MLGVAAYLVSGPPALMQLATNTSALASFWFVYPLDPALPAAFTEGGAGAGGAQLSPAAASCQCQPGAAPRLDACGNRACQPA